MLTNKYENNLFYHQLFYDAVHHACIPLTSSGITSEASEN